MRWLFQVGQWTCPEIDHKVQTSKKFLITSHFPKVWSISFLLYYKLRQNIFKSFESSSENKSRFSSRCWLLPKEKKHLHQMKVKLNLQSVFCKTPPQSTKRKISFYLSCRSVCCLQVFQCLRGLTEIDTAQHKLILEIKWGNSKQKR